jgi:predicted amidophosphoribosyltransferase
VDEGRDEPTSLRYHLCPHCARAVPAGALERYCVNDGAQLMQACPACGGAITSPYARYCPACGHEYADHERIHA